MTNREQIAWAFGFSDYADSDIADIVSDMLDAANVAYLGTEDRKRIEKWLGLQCDSETIIMEFWRRKKNEKRGSDCYFAGKQKSRKVHDR